MFRHFLATVFVFVAILLTTPAASAMTATEALARMDAIIKEMQTLRVEFASLMAVSSTASSPTPAVQGATSGTSLTMDLSYGSTNEDIARIQRLLATDPAIYPYGVASGFFGPKTEEAIRNFQSRFGLDPVGVVGPATTALLEVFFAAYPDENYPAGVLDKKPSPAVQGVSTSQTVTSVTPTYSSGTNPAEEINVQIDDDEALIEIIYTNGNRKGLVADTDDEDEVVRFIASKTVLTEAQVRAVIDFDDDNSSRRDDSDEDDAEDALDEADEAIDDADDEIDEARDDDEDTNWAEDTLDDAEDKYEAAEKAFEDEEWDEAVELAKEARDLARKAEDRIGEEEGSEKGDSDDIESIEAEVEEDEAKITVEYSDGDDYEFDVEEDKENKIIEEVADELNLDEDEVEDLIEFDYGDIDYIDALIEDDRTVVYVYYESGASRRFVLDEDDEDDIVKEIADLIDEDDDDVEDLIEFDYK